VRVGPSSLKSFVLEFYVILGVLRIIQVEHIVGLVVMSKAGYLVLWACERVRFASVGSNKCCESESEAKKQGSGPMLRKSDVFRDGVRVTGLSSWSGAGSDASNGRVLEP
jgi:hypothetical protein